MTRFDEAKAWIRGAFRSSTMWFNSSFAAVAGIVAELPSVLPDLAPMLPPSIYKWLLFANVLGNMALRVKTRVALIDK